VADEHVFNRMLSDLNKKEDNKPFFNVLLTLTSHEPFTVPMKKVMFKGNRDESYKNAMYYSDSCIGKFIDQAKQQKWWKNTVIIFVADHCFGFEGQPNYPPLRFHIPMLWTGGAIQKAKKIETLAGQTDIAGTLLGQLNIDSKDFLFTKNIFDAKSPRFCFYSYNHGLGLIENGNVGMFDLNTKQIIDNSDKNLCKKGEAYLQCSFDDLGKR
jgi:phosphoglycerol transferase MdoB-like AlkP superfamily enzyme